MAYRRSSVHASDPQDCIYTDKLNMPWDVPEHWGQLAHRSYIQSRVHACWKWSWEIITPELCPGIVWASAIWHRTEVCQGTLKSLRVKMITYTPCRVSAKGKLCVFPKEEALFCGRMLFKIRCAFLGTIKVRSAISEWQVSWQIALLPVPPFLKVKREWVVSRQNAAGSYWHKCDVLDSPWS